MLLANLPLANLLSPSLCRTAITCPSLMAPVNGSLSTTGRRVYDVAEFVCYPGHFLLGGSALQCDLDGRWNASVPTCAGMGKATSSISCRWCATVETTSTTQEQISSKYMLLKQDLFCVC